MEEVKDRQIAMIDAETAWRRELDMWVGIVAGQVPEYTPDGPWASPEARMRRVEHIALVIGLRLSLAPAEGQLADELVRRGA